MFVEVLEELRGGFESRFSDVKEHENIFSFIKNPFQADVSSFNVIITQLCPFDCAALESETAELQTNNHLKVKVRVGVDHFCNLVSEADFPTLKGLVQE